MAAATTEGQVINWKNCVQKNLELIVAVDENGGIGKDGGLPWKLKGDMAFFKEVTTAPSSGDGTEGSSGRQNAVIMGKSTYLSIPPSYRPLDSRVNIVLSTTADPDSEEMKGATVVRSFVEALLLVDVELADSVDRVFVIGGATVFQKALAYPRTRKVYITNVAGTFDCDTFFPTLPSDFQEAEHDCRDGAEKEVEEDGVKYVFAQFVRTEPPEGNTEERQYLDLVRDIIENGDKRGDRTGVGTFSKFGCQVRFDLSRSFPLLTTKRVFFRGLAEELLWFVHGSTDSKLLSDKNVHIWDANGSREFLDKRGLTDREEGDLGPVYGFQWRHFGAEYVDCHTDYSGQGYDQLAAIIETIKTNPNDRRMVMSAWNPAALAEMALPPCHMFAQFYVSNGRLSCQMYQRSCDMGLGVPFNIASYALLTYMMASVCDLAPGEFILAMGDAHVYQNHVEPLLEQLEREPRPFPTLRVNPNVRDIDDFTMDDFSLEGYKPYKTIKMEMAV